MKNRIVGLAAAVGLVALSNFAVAQNPPVAAVPEDPARQELRAVRDAMVKAFNERDYDGFVRHLHPNVVATWQNAEVARHPDGVKAFMNKMTEGDAKVVDRMQTDLKLDEAASLYNGGNTAIAFGSVDQSFKLAKGGELALTSRWTATFVKEDGRWLLAAIQVSGDLFHNPVLAVAARKTAQWVGFGSLFVGLFAGWMLGRTRKGKAPLPA
jgi:ketosteroid isomerase-like protein